MEETNGNRPEKKFSTGAISVAVWCNKTVKDGKETEFRTVSLERRYKKGEEWHSTNTLRVSDLPKAALVLNKAFEYLVLNGAEEQAA